MNRQEMINRLIADDISIIMASYEAMDAEYISSILEDGFRGYKNYAARELMDGFNNREFPDS